MKDLTCFTPGCSPVLGFDVESAKSEAANAPRISPGSLAWGSEINNLCTLAQDVEGETLATFKRRIFGRRNPSYVLNSKM